MISPETTESSSRTEVQNAETEPLKLRRQPLQGLQKVALLPGQDANMDQMYAQKGCEGVSEESDHCVTRYQKPPWRLAWMATMT